MNIGFQPVLDKDVDINFKRLQDAITQLPGNLDDYVTEAALTAALASYVTNAALTSALTAYLTTTAFNTAMAQVDRFANLEKWGPL